MKQVEGHEKLKYDVCTCIVLWFCGFIGLFLIKRKNTY